MTVLPCAGNAALYDALFDDVPAPQRHDAQTKAAALCSSCPSPCPDKVTTATTPRTVELLPTGWMPATSEGHPEPQQPAFGKRSTRQDPVPPIGRDYVPPGKRAQAWARMAAERAAQGWQIPDIALHLCVTEDTARALLALTQQQAA